MLHSNPAHLGKKTGRGFYVYENGKQKGLWRCPGTRAPAPSV